MSQVNLNEAEILTIKSLSFAKNYFDKYIVLLNKKYGYSLTKQDLSVVLNISIQTIDRRIKENMNIPAYKKSGEGIKASYIFPITEVAKFLCSTIKINN